MRISVKGLLIGLCTALGISITSLGLTVFCISGIVGMFCWPYTINTWLIFAGKPIAVVWWQGFLMGMIPKFGKFSLPFAVATWIILMFL